MAFSEVTVVQVKEALRRWLRGEGKRTIAKGSESIAWQPVSINSEKS